MYHFLHVPLSTCTTLYMYHLLHVQLSTCTTLYMYHSLHVPLSTCTSLCMYHSLHVPLTTCTTLYMYLSLHVPLSACTTLYMYLSLHVPLSTCTTLYMYHSLHIPLSTCTTLYMYHSLHVPLSTCTTLYMYHSLHVPPTTCTTLYMYHRLIRSRMQPTATMYGDCVLTCKLCDSDVLWLGLCPFWLCAGVYLPAIVFSFVNLIILSSSLTAWCSYMAWCSCNISLCSPIQVQPVGTTEIYLDAFLLDKAPVISPKLDPPAPPQHALEAAYEFLKGAVGGKWNISLESTTTVSLGHISKTVTTLSNIV